MSNLSDFRVNTDYDTPWIIWKHSASFWLGATEYYKEFRIDHGLPFVPLIFGQWSLQPDFSQAYDLADDVPDYGGYGQPPFALTVSADGSAVSLTFDNNTGQGRTFYIRLMAFAPPEFAGSISPVDFSSSLSYNSDYNYQKLLMSGATSSTVNHRLGYIPQCRVWYRAKRTGVVRLVDNIVAIDAQNLFFPSLDSATEVIYHIYGDRLDG